MSNISSKFLNRLFQRVGGLVWELTTGKLGIKDTNGIYTLESTPAVAATRDTPAVEASSQIVVNPFDSFGIDIPAFATSTSLADVAVGDIIVGESSILGWVVDKKPASLVLLDKSGMRKQYNPPKVTVIGTGNNVLVVKNLLNLAGGQDGLAGLQGNLLPLLMLGGDTENALEDILPLLLFSQGNNAAAGGMSSILPLLLLKKGGLGGSGGISDLLPLLALGGLGGAGAAGGLNPLALLALSGGLGGNKEVVTLAPVGTPPLQRVTRR